MSCFKGKDLVHITKFFTIYAYDGNDNPIGSDEGSYNSGSNSNLEVNNSNIAYVILSDGCRAYDDLEYDTYTGTPIPEFPTIALPVLSVIGLMFMFQRRMDK
ncbi:MAG TPA: PEF-CTERM sorting domain-containing protein [Methanosarcinaceae archaeon]|nr:PEF-CTERM sorting domain-containing protein [Methanosarcinaceae archaeon]